MTLADYRRAKKPAGHEEPAAVAAGQAVHAQARPGERPHPGPLEYAQIGVALAVVTLMEVAIYYIEALDDVLVPILLALSALKFSLVALWFMHLRFDNRLFTTFFVGGLLLTLSVFAVVLATFGASLA